MKAHEMATARGEEDHHGEENIEAHPTPMRHPSDKYPTPKACAELREEIVEERVVEKGR